MASARSDGVELRASTVTVASRIMLPAYLALVTWYGLIYLINPQGRLDTSHGLTFQRHLAGGTMAPWGAMFLALAVFLAIQMLRGSRNDYILGLCIMVAVCILWSGGFVVSIFQDSETSFTAPTPWAFYATAGIASALSLKAQEVFRLKTRED